MRWQDKTFPKKTPHSIADHLGREVQELKDSVGMGSAGVGSEVADVQILLWGLAEEMGINILQEVSDKFYGELIHRKWKQPDERGVVEHIK